VESNCSSADLPIALDALYRKMVFDSITAGLGSGKNIPTHSHPSECCDYHVKQYCVKNAVQTSALSHGLPAIGKMVGFTWLQLRLTSRPLPADGATVQELDSSERASQPSPAHA
jgi:hypothetical protein